MVFPRGYVMSFSHQDYFDNCMITLSPRMLIILTTMMMLTMMMTTKTTTMMMTTMMMRLWPPYGNLQFWIELFG